MRVPRVGAFALKKRDHVAERLEILEYFAASVAIENHQWDAPEALARNAPIGPVRDHVVDALFAPRRQPLYFFDFVQRSAAQSRRVRGRNRCAAAIKLYEPLFGSTKNHGSVAAPAMRIAVRKLLFADKHAALRQQRDDDWIRFEVSLALVLGQAFNKASFVIERSV